MRQIRVLLQDCCAATDHSLGFDLKTQLSGKTIQVQFDGSYPTSEELEYFRHDPDHIVSIAGANYKRDTLPEDLLGQVFKRTHDVAAILINKLCVSNYINYIDVVNLFEDESPTTKKMLSDFEHFYSVLRLTSDNELRQNYRRYWREITLNNAYAILRNDNEFSAGLNNRAKPILHTSLTNLTARL